MDELVAECDDLGAAGSEIVKAILTAFIQSESGHAKQERDHYSETKGFSLTIYESRALSARYSKGIFSYNNKKCDYSVGTIL